MGYGEIIVLIVKGIVDNLTYGFLYLFPSALCGIPFHSETLQVIKASNNNNLPRTINHRTNFSLVSMVCGYDLSR